MDDEDYDYDVVVLDERNAPPVRRPPHMITRPAVRPWPRTVRKRAYYTSPNFRPMPPPRPTVVVQRQPSLLDDIDFGEIVDQGVTFLAAMQSLPAAPSVTGDPSKDVGNMILYQEALGDHAKSDERVRAFGGLVAQAVKVLVKNAQQRGSQGG